MSGLAAVGECALSGGFRATVLTRPVGVIDVAVFVVPSVRATDTLVVVVLRWEGVERPVVGCVFDGGHVFAEGAAVDVIGARTGHQVFGHVVEGDCVLVGSGVVVAPIGDFDESGGIDVEGKLFTLCAFRAVSSASSAADCFVLMVFSPWYLEDRCRVVLSTRRVSTYARGHRSSYAKLCTIA